MAEAAERRLREQEKRGLSNQGYAEMQLKQQKKEDEAYYQQQ